MDKLTIGYFGDGPWSHQSFDRIMDDPDLDIRFVCPRFDVRDPILVEKAQRANIDVIFEKNVNAADSLLRIENYDCDLLVSMSFNQIFRQVIIEMPRKGLINCHAGKLPFYRGRNILNWVLINDESDFGITVHYVDEGIDTGDIILQRTFPITDQDDYGTLLDTAYVECAHILYDAIKQIQLGSQNITKQSSIHEVGMYCGRRQEGDELFSWDQPSRDVFNFVRAIADPGPSASCRLDGQEVKIKKVEMINASPAYKGIPGQVVGKDHRGLIVKTRDTVLRVVNAETPRKIRVGDRFE